MIPMGNRLGFLALDLDFKGWILGLGSKGEMYYAYSAYRAVQGLGGYLEQRHMKLYYIHFWVYS
jgi:hypothetical protein